MANVWIVYYYTNMVQCHDINLKKCQYPTHHTDCDSIKLYEIFFFNEENQPSDTMDCEFAVNNTSQEKKL